MALTANILPAVPPFTALPLDANYQFASAQTVTATGYVNNSNQQLNIGGGRVGFFVVLDLSAESGTTPSFQFHLMGSNDVNWGNGNVEDLMEFDWAGASAQRLVPTIVGASIAIPDTGRAGSLIVKPCWNFGQGLIVYQYIRLYAVLAGTSPSVTLSAWISPFEFKI